MAETCTWQEMREEHISIANELPLPPKDMNQIMQAREDVKNCETRHLLQKRESCPSRLTAC